MRNILNLNKNNSILLFVLPFIVVLVLTISIVLIISIICFISIIGIILIAFLVPISIVIILLIVLSYLSGNILYFSIFFDDYNQRMFLFKILQNISNFSNFGPQDIYRLVVNILVELRKYSNYMDRRRSNLNINVFRIFFDERRNREFSFEEELNNLFTDNETFSNPF